MVADDIDDKPWWQSRAVIGSLVTIVASVAGLVGYSVNAGVLAELLFGLATLVGGALSWWGRVRATQPISKRQVLPGVTIRGA